MMCSLERGHLTQETSDHEDDSDKSTEEAKRKKLSRGQYPEALSNFTSFMRPLSPVPSTTPLFNSNNNKRKASFPWRSQSARLPSQTQLKETRQSQSLRNSRTSSIWEKLKLRYSGDKANDMEEIGLSSTAGRSASTSDDSETDEEPEIYSLGESDDSDRRGTPEFERGRGGKENVKNGKSTADTAIDELDRVMSLGQAVAMAMHRNLISVAEAQLVMWVNTPDFMNKQLSAKDVVTLAADYLTWSRRMKRLDDFCGVGRREGIDQVYKTIDAFAEEKTRPSAFSCRTNEGTPTSSRGESSLRNHVSNAARRVRRWKTDWWPKSMRETPADGTRTRSAKAALESSETKHVSNNVPLFNDERASTGTLSAAPPQRNSSLWALTRQSNCFLLQGDCSDDERYAYAGIMSTRDSSYRSSILESESARQSNCSNIRRNKTFSCERQFETARYEAALVGQRQGNGEIAAFPSRNTNRISVFGPAMNSTANRDNPQTHFLKLKLRLPKSPKPNKAAKQHEPGRNVAKSPPSPGFLKEDSEARIRKVFSSGKKKKHSPPSYEALSSRRLPIDFQQFTFPSGARDSETTHCTRLTLTEVDRHSVTSRSSAGVLPSALVQVESDIPNPSGDAKATTDDREVLSLTKTLADDVLPPIARSSS